MNKKFKNGDLVKFKFSDHETSPCLIVGSEEHIRSPFFSKYYTYHVYIVDVGVIQRVLQRDLKKWK